MSVTSSSATDPQLKIVGLEVSDVRFPTSFDDHGSDASHPAPDYSAVYVRLVTNSRDLTGCGLSFTLGRGNELVMHAVDSLRFLAIDRFVVDIQENMGAWVYALTNEDQLRWVGPEKGVIALAVAAIVNAFWDLWGKIEKKPVWKLLADMSPQKIVSLIDFRYIDDLVTKEEAVEMLERAAAGKAEREERLWAEGYPAYTTQVGWLGYSDDKVKSLADRFLGEGFTAFKMKVGKDLEDDKRRLQVIREAVGPDMWVSVDANQKWGVEEAIAWMEQLKDFNLTWIEEPTSPDDILGHAKISRALKKHGIGVATGEMCQNRVMFKQFLQSGAMQFCQIDSARMSGLNDVLAVYLMAAKVGVPVCPHAGGVGLCEMVQHLQMFDYVAVSGRMDNGRMIEHVAQLHEHFLHPVTVKNARYMAPTDHGYSTEMHPETVRKYEYPHGAAWRQMFRDRTYWDPSLEQKLLVPDREILH